MPNNLICIRDSREHTGKGWMWPGTIITKLSAGDYSIKDLESIVSIERKGSSDELYSNFGTKKNKKRFYAELDLLSKYKYKYIIIESTLSQILYGSRWSRLSPTFVIQLLQEIELGLGIHVLMLEKGDLAQKYVGSLLEMIASKEFGIKMRIPSNDETLIVPAGA